MMSTPLHWFALGAFCASLLWSGLSLALFALFGRSK